MNVQEEIKIQKEIDDRMTSSIKTIMAKYGGVPAAVLDKEFSQFIADVYVAGAADAILTLKEKK